MSAVDRRRTERLLLTRLGTADFADLHAMHSDARVMATLGGVRTREETERVLAMLVADWDAHGFGYWRARDLASGSFAGRGGLRRVVLEGQPEVEVGYALMPEFWGRGLATELARESIRVAFGELGLDSLVCFTLPTNTASQRVMQRAGFRYAGETMWADQPHVLYRLAAADVR
jgi:ribosomal-protein-alanine N-acetyltransferase